MATSTNPKTYAYHVSKNGAFKGILINVIGDFAYQQELNSAGSAITITLGTPADSYGEGGLIDFNNDIQVYEIDDTNINGVLIFRGFITNYKTVFTDKNQEQVVLTVMGYGATLNDYIIESGESVDVNQNSQNSNFKSVQGPTPMAGAYIDVIQSLTTGIAVTKLSAAEFVIAANAADDIGNSAFLQIFSSRSDAEGGGVSSIIGSANLPITSLSPVNYKYTFATAITVTPSTTYWARLSYVADNHTLGGAGDPGYAGAMNVYYDSTVTYGTLETVANNGTAWLSPATVTGAAYIKSYSSTGSTQSTYTGQDPSAILKSIIDNYIAQGGKITYTAASIDLTNTSVTYTFNANTVFEGIQKCADLAPAGWYWYVDQANNVLHFHKVASSANHTFMFGKNIRNLAVEKRAQDIVNAVYFVGGPVAGINLYQKYVQQTSIDIYGRHAIRYTDNNVTLAATAQIIATSILTSRAQVELRIDLDILDDGGNSSSALGFDIESIVLGESVSFRSLGPGSGGTLWDVAKWDVAKWDFDITDLSSIVVQVTKIDYSPDNLHLSLSTVPPDITKRVENIYRNLVQVSTLSNPSTPS